MSKSKAEELPPAYTEVDDNTPLLGSTSEPVQVQPQPVPYPYTTAVNMESISVPPLQVLTASTLTPVPIRLVDGRIYLTVLEPVRMFCSYCRTNVTTTLEDKATCCAYTSCIVLFYVCTPLCLVPFCMKDCRQQVHMCSRCGSSLALVTSVE
jgi:hypothetical protein